MTLPGRVIAGGLMLGGIALLGVITATFASWLIARVQDEEQSQAATRGDVEALASEVRALRDELSRSKA